jgi:ornithine carbamoyltransferase
MSHGNIRKPVVETMMKRHFLDLLDLTPEEVNELLERTARIKAAWQQGKREPILLGRVLGLVFEKPSLRTRASFQSAMAQLGGASVFMTAQEAGLGSRETVADFAQVMSQYVDAVVLRTYSHATVVEFARNSCCPVINGLSDYYHPCQALGDLFTLREEFGSVAGRTVAFIGDGNNVARSLAICCAKLSVNFVLAAPEGYGSDEPFLRLCEQSLPRERLLVNGSPDHAVRDADIIYTDVWTSMGQEAEHEKRLKAFTGYQVNETLLAKAPQRARFMHCLPAHRGEEVSAGVMDGDRSLVFRQAGNRMHAQKALLLWLLGM